ncbi:hypothetical protein JHK84_057131 [Glycine max]|nr:hypothetical protein JHK86_057071 [Glycine max]KAG4919817.1 hypothetical protein JHK85_058098 [Glycine max]KAG5075900.1 hypothetical protein JHK84_057131 [Glycine max]
MVKRETIGNSFDRFCLGCLGHLRDYNLNVMAAKEWVFVFLAAEYETPKKPLNQISLWDGIIPSKDHAKFWIHTSNKYRFIDQASHITGSPGMVVASPGTIQSTGQPAATQLGQHQLAYQQQQQQLQQRLQAFWANQYQEIKKVTDFKNHSLPLARIKKIMKADEDVRMISAEAPVIFARACEMFILELTLRSWNHTEENKRRTLQKNDIAAAITRTDIFDFLVDIVPREDLKDEVLASMPRGTVPVTGPAEALPYCYIPPQHAQQVGAAGVMMGNKPVMDPYAQQSHPYNMAPQMWPQLLPPPPPEQQQSSPDQ